VRFEPTIPKSDQSHTLALDRAVTGIGDERGFQRIGYRGRNVDLKRGKKQEAVGNVVEGASRFVLVTRWYKLGQIREEKTD
jgi:hypothetical protein